MGNFNTSTFDLVKSTNPAVSPEDCPRLDQVQGLIAPKSNSTDVDAAIAAATHPAVTVDTTSQTLALTVDGNQKVGGEVKIAAETELQAAATGISVNTSAPTSLGQRIDLGKQAVLNVAIHQNATELLAVEGTDYTVDYENGVVIIVEGSAMISTPHGVDVYFDCARVMDGPGIEATDAGLALKFGEAHNEVKRGDDVPTNDHLPASGNTANKTVAITVNSSQVISAALIPATSGGLMNTDGGAAVDFSQVAAENHVHAAVTTDASGFMTPAMLAALAAATASSPVTGKTDTDTISITKTGGAISADVRKGFGLVSDSDGLKVNTDQIAIKGHTHAVTTGVLVITLIDGGSGYTSATVVISGDGANATANVTVAGGAVTGFTITNPGWGYTYATAEISGNGTNATASVTIAVAGFVSPDEVAEVKAHETRILEAEDAVSRLAWGADGQVVLYGSNYDGSGQLEVFLTQGRFYHWKQSEHDTSIVNGGQTMTVESTFIAAGSSVILHGTAGTSITARVTDVTAESKSDEALDSVQGKLSIPIPTTVVDVTAGTTNLVTHVYASDSWAYQDIAYSPTAKKYYLAIRPSSAVAPPNAGFWAELKPSYTAPTWASGAYTQGQIVTYTVDGLIHYCHTNTTSNQVPTDTAFWGLLIPFTPAKVDLILDPNGGLVVGDAGLKVNPVTAASEVFEDSNSIAFTSGGSPVHVHAGVKIPTNTGLTIGSPGLDLDPDHRLATVDASGFLSSSDFKLLRSLGGGSGAALVGFNQPVREIVVDGANIYVGGAFSLYGSVGALGVCKLNLSGVLDLAWAPGGIGTIGVLKKAGDGDIILGSSTAVRKVNPINGTVNKDITPETGLMGLATSTNKFALLYPQAIHIFTNAGDWIKTKDGTVDFSSIEGAGGTKMVVSSRAYTSTGVPQQYDSTTNPKGLRLFNSDEQTTPIVCSAGALDPAFVSGAGTGAEATCDRIAVAPDGSYFIVGNTLARSGLDYSWDGGNAANFIGLYKIKSDGTADTGFAANIVLTGDAGNNGPIPFCIDSAGYIYVGGPIHSIYNGTTQINVTPWGLYRLKATGEFDFEFAGFDGRVLAVALNGDNQLFAGGEFEHYQTRGVGFFVAVNRDAVVVEPGDQTNSPGSDIGFVKRSRTALDVTDPKFKRYLWLYPALPGDAPGTVPVLSVYSELEERWISICDVCSIAGGYVAPIIPVAANLDSWLLNFNIGPYSNDPKTGAAAIGSSVIPGFSGDETADHWNILSFLSAGTAGGPALKFADGSNAPTGITISSPALSSSYTSTIPDEMMATYGGLGKLNAAMDPGPNQIDLPISLPDGLYDVYIYSHGPDDRISGATVKGYPTIVIGDDSDSWRPSPFWRFIDGINYAHIAAVRPSGGFITVTVPMVLKSEMSPSSMAYINGIQIFKTATLLPPNFSPKSNTATSTVSIASPQHTTSFPVAVYYTLTTDGTEPASPTTGSTLYTTPISISVIGTRIKAKCIYSPYTNSDDASAIYAP
jgi:hypothetical protein